MKKILAILTMWVAGIMVFSANAAVVNASFPGGQAAQDEYIKNNLKYPERAKQNGIEGVVDVTFVVHKDGSIGSIKIVRMIDPDLEQEAIRLVKLMPKWTPATDNGTPIESDSTLKIDFTIE